MRIFKNLRRSLRRSSRTVFTVIVVAVVLLANIAFSAFASTRNLFIDLTAYVSDATLRGMGLVYINKSIDRNMYDHKYTSLPALYSAIENVDGEVTILFCSDPDVLMSNEKTRYVYIMALDLAKKFDFISVKTVNAALNPGAVEQYKTTSASTISWSNVIFTVPGGEYRIYNINRFYAVDEDSGNTVGYMGELQFATAILSLTATNLPKVCFTSGHGETVPSPYDENTDEFYNMIVGLGFNVVTIDLDTEDIPEDCYLVVMNGTQTDYEVKSYTDIDYISPIEKLERFLSNYGSLMYFRDSTAGTLTNLEAMLYEWGFEFDNTVVRDTTSCISGTPGKVIASYASDDTLGFAMYSDIASLATPPVAIVEEANPITLLWGDDNSYHYSNSAGRYSSSVLLSSPSAHTYDGDGYVVDGDGNYVLMAVTRQTSIIENTYFYSYVFVSGTDSFTASEYFQSTYANYDVMNNVIYGVAREGLTVDGIAADDYKQYTADTENISGLTSGAAMAWVIVMAAVPVVILSAAGVYVNVRRRHR